MKCKWTAPYCYCLLTQKKANGGRHIATLTNAEPIDGILLLPPPPLPEKERKGGCFTIIPFLQMKGKWRMPYCYIPNWRANGGCTIATPLSHSNLTLQELYSKWRSRDRYPPKLRENGGRPIAIPQWIVNDGCTNSFPQLRKSADAQ